VFEKLKGIFTKKPVLAVPNLDKIRIEVDESDYTIGGVLSMERGYKKWMLVAYLSKLLKYNTIIKFTTKRCFMIIRGLEN